MIQCNFLFQVLAQSMEDLELMEVPDFHKVGFVTLFFFCYIVILQ